MNLHLISTTSPLIPADFPTSCLSGDQVGVRWGFSGDDFWIDI